VYSLYPRTIPLANNKGVAIVDDADYDRLNARRWCNNGHGYAVRTQRDSDGHARRIYLHHEVLGVPSPDVIDHINGNKLDNRRANLRVVTPSENLQNVRHPSRNNKSGFLGVSKDGRRWRAQLRVNKRQVHVGLFGTPEEAHQAYWTAKKELCPHLAEQ
jgi:hypothetical protein